MGIKRQVGRQSAYTWALTCRETTWCAALILGFFIFLEISLSTELGWTGWE